MDERFSVLYAFKYWDDVRNRWVTARYRASREDIAARHAKWETIGEPEKRERGDGFPGLFKPTD